MVIIAKYAVFRQGEKSSTDSLCRDKCALSEANGKK